VTSDLLINEQVLRVGHPVGEETARGPGIDTPNSLQPEQCALEMSAAYAE